MGMYLDMFSIFSGGFLSGKTQNNWFKNEKLVYNTETAQLDVAVLFGLCNAASVISTASKYPLIIV